MKTKAIQTWTCGRLLLEWGIHSGVSVESASRGIEDRTASVVLIVSSAWRNFTQPRTTARRSTTVAVDLPLFARIFIQLLVLDGVERLFGHDQAPSKRLLQQQVSGNLLFFATCASLPRRWTVHSPFFVFFSYKLSQFSTSDCSRRAATQTLSKILLPPKPMKAHAIRSMLAVLAAAESATEDRFQRRRPTRLTVSRTLSAPSSRRSKATELSQCQDNKLAGRQTRRVDVFYQNLPHVKNSESRFTSTCLPPSRVLWSATDQCKSQVAIGNLCYASYKQSTHWWTASRGVKKAKFNLFLDQLPRQISSSNFYQTRVRR